MTYAGTLSGSGGGTVQLTNGTFDPGLGGVTFNFPGSMLQWTGGVMSAAIGDVTNVGALNLAGSNEKYFVNNGTLDDIGTIVQTVGTGNFGLHSGSGSPTTLKIEPVLFLPDRVRCRYR